MEAHEISFRSGFSDENASASMLRMDAETKAALRILLLAVIAGTNALRTTECKMLTQDPNPEWFSWYDGFGVKMHTSLDRQAISGLKVMYKAGEYSFFNVGYGRKPVGPSKAVNEWSNCFSDWTDCLAWDEAKQFLAKVLADSKAMNPYVRG